MTINVQLKSNLDLNSILIFLEWDYKMELELPTDNNYTVTNFQIISNFSYNVISMDNKLYIYGLINGEFNQIRSHTFVDIIRQITASDIYTLILLTNGDIYKLEISSNSLRKLSFLNIENVISKNPIESIESIQSGGTFSIAMTSDNNVYSIPSKIHTFPKHIKVRKICCGAEHTLILTTNGDVYAFGSSALVLTHRILNRFSVTVIFNYIFNYRRGQLGLGSLDMETSPVLVNALAGIKVS